MTSSRLLGLALAAALLVAASSVAHAQDTDTPITPPADQAALVAAPTSAAKVPTFDTKAADSTSLSLSAGGQLATGNSRLLALTGNGVFAMRRSQHGFGASLIGNYGQGAPPGQPVVSTAENVQGKVRYDYFVSDRLSAFGLVTGRHDRFQGLDFRLNLDPGVKYLIVNKPTLAFWGELGYDFQYDIRRDDARNDSTSTTTGDMTTTVTTRLDKTHSDHAARLYAGFHDDFNKNVALTTGLEFIPSVVDSNRYWLNYDALLTAGIAGGLSFGFGLSMRYDHDPLPGKADLDTTTTLSLIYAFTSPGDTPVATAAAPEANSAPPPCDCTKAGTTSTTPVGPGTIIDDSKSSTPATPSSPAATPPAATPPSSTPSPAPQSGSTPPGSPGGVAPGGTNTTTVKPSGE